MGGCYVKRLIQRGLILLVGVGLLAVATSKTTFANAISDIFSNMTTAQKLMPSELKANSAVDFDIVLKPRNLSGLYQQALAVNNPVKPEFKQYLTATGVRDQYGQPTSVTDDWTQFLKHYQLKTSTYHNGLILNVSGKAKNANRLFKVNLNQALYHANPLQFGNRKPSIPARLAKTVWTTLGVTDHNSRYFYPESKINFFGSTMPINYAKNFGDTSRFANHYKVTPLYQRGLTGKGQTIGIIAFGGINWQDVSHFWKHEKVNTNKSRYTVKRVNSGLFDPSLVDEGEEEAEMDVEYAGSVAPKANIRLYRVKSSVPTLMNFVNAYATAYDENQAGSLSSSWGLGTDHYLQLLKQHRVLSPKYLQVMNLIFAQGALEGISNFVASGDNGGPTYTVSGLSGSKVLLDRTVNDADPYSTSPWITSIGGTTLPFSKKYQPADNVLGVIQVNKERSWGTDYYWPILQNNPNFFAKMPEFLPEIGEGSGGGFAHMYNTPDYQQGVPGINTFSARQYLSQLNQPSFNPALVTGIDSGRNYPDVSANADANTGYLIYTGDTWRVGGGTSIVTPQFAAVTALINSQTGRPRMGFWNPQLYRLAVQSDTPFTPLNDTEDNSNLYYTGQPNTDYNQASGLGIVNFEKLMQTYR